MFAPTALANINHTTQIILGRVYRDGTDTHILNAGAYFSNYMLKSCLRSFEVDGFTRASGMSTTSTGTRNLAISAGVFYCAHNRFTCDALDTSGTDTFTMHYHTSGAWDSASAQTAVNNTQYDDGSDLATLTAQRYGVHWLYMHHDCDLHMVTGYGDYTLAQAIAASVPGSLPPILVNMSFLIAKIVVQKSSDTLEIDHPWDVSFETSSVADHNDLGNIQGGAAGDYYHLTAANRTDLTDGGDTTLHDHAGITENTAARHTQDTDTILTTNGSTALINAGVIKNNITADAGKTVDGVDISVMNLLRNADRNTIVTGGGTLAWGYPTTIDLWNKMEDATSSTIGNNFVEDGTVDYAAAKFNNGVQVDAVGEAAHLAAGDADGDIADGAIEFWYKCTETSIVDGKPQGGNTLTMFSWYDAGGVYEHTVYWHTGVGLTWDVNDSGGIDSRSTTDASLDLTQNTLYHLAFYWDNDGSPYRWVQITEDGESTSTVAFPAGAWNGGKDMSSTTLYIGGYRGAAANFSCGGIIDNWKWWNYKKTDYSDKYTEDVSYTFEWDDTIRIDCMGKLNGSDAAYYHTIAASSIPIPEGDFAYVTLDRTTDAKAVTMSTMTPGDSAISDDMVILAYHCPVDNKLYHVIGNSVSAV